nr:hypothetical protein [Tanacetum cinerariifolium]
IYRSIGKSWDMKTETVCHVDEKGRGSGTCLVVGHSVDECQKAPKRVVNTVDKGKGESSGTDDDGFIEVKKKKSGGNNEDTKNFKPISVKQKLIYRPKPTGEAGPKTASPANMKKVSIPNYSLKKTIQTNASTSGNGTFSLSNSYEVLNADNSIDEDVDSGDRIVMSSGRCVLLDDEGKPVKRIDYTSDYDIDNEVESVDNDMSRFLASNPSGAGYGTNSLLEQ